MFATIQELANIVRVHLIEEFGEAGYARQMMTFDDLSCADVIYVLGIIENYEPHHFLHRLAVCWLAGNGWGNSDYFDL